MHAKGVWGDGEIGFTVVGVSDVGDALEEGLSVGWCGWTVVDVAEAVSSLLSTCRLTFLGITSVGLTINVVH